MECIHNVNLHIFPSGHRYVNSMWNSREISTWRDGVCNVENETPIHVEFQREYHHEKYQWISLLFSPNFHSIFTEFQLFFNLKSPSIKQYKYTSNNIYLFSFQITNHSLILPLVGMLQVLPDRSPDLRLSGLVGTPNCIWNMKWEHILALCINDKYISSREVHICNSNHQRDCSVMSGRILVHDHSF